MEADTSDFIILCIYNLPSMQTLESIASDKLTTCLAYYCYRTGDWKYFKSLLLLETITYMCL